MSYDKGLAENINIVDPDSVHSILASGKVLEPSSIASFEKSSDFLRNAEINLKSTRYQWIGIYLG